jgi:hypothetical protein
MKIAKKQVRIIKKIREASGVWRFISLQRVGSRYVWDDRYGHYFLDWREGRKRNREYAGSTPSEATEAQRRKRNELLGALISHGKTCASPKRHPACIFNNFIKLLAARIDDAVHRLRRSRSPLQPPAAALPLVPEHPWQAINEFATCDNTQSRISEYRADVSLPEQ